MFFILDIGFFFFAFIIFLFTFQKLMTQSVVIMSQFGFICTQSIYVLIYSIIITGILYMVYSYITFRGIEIIGILEYLNFTNYNVDMLDKIYNSEHIINYTKGFLIEKIKDENLL